MSFPDVIALSSDDEDMKEVEVNDVKPIILSHSNMDIKEYFMKNSFQEQNIYGNLVSSLPSDIYQINQTNNSGKKICNALALQNTSLLCRQFWKSGDFEARPTLAPVSGKNRLRIHPKFLHSNATSHKWAFGAIAELLDNAVDEVHNGATVVVVDKLTNPRNGEAALLIQDDGGGMDPESLRRCMSFGFSDKRSSAAIGQYGNGFKTSTMRLGADVVVLSRHKSERIITQSIGLLSYTFLRKTGSDDIVVPVVDYEFNKSIGVFARRLRSDEKQFSTNLSTILSWSPFSSESELLDQFNDIGQHGTKVIVFNIWYNDDGEMELDFETDSKDILINKTQRKYAPKKVSHELIQKNVASRLQYSLRAYSSILYLRIPEGFKIILRGEVVMQHHVVNDLKYLECVVYRPQVEGYPEILTTLGFLKGAPNVDVHGFNVYHKNRLILPFWRVANNSYGKGRGVVGVLEANFIKPTHDKQDFEKSSIYQKLESRLKEMTYEYWDLHCHLIGYKHCHPSKKTLHNMGSIAPPAQQMVPHLEMLSNNSPQGKLIEHCPSKIAFQNMGSIASPPKQMVPHLETCSNNLPQGKLIEHNLMDQPGIPHKRKQENNRTIFKYLKKQAVAIRNGEGLASDHKPQLELSSEHKQIQEVKIMLGENNKLREQCLELEEREKELLLKEEKLRRILNSFEILHQKLSIQLKSLEEVKMEKL